MKDVKIKQFWSLDQMGYGTKKNSTHVVGNFKCVHKMSHVYPSLRLCTIGGI
jgi:hypothetical protein